MRLSGCAVRGVDALETLLRPIAAMVNRQIQAKTPARDLCEALQDRVFAVRVKDSALAMYVTIEDNQVRLASDSDAEADVVIEGSLIALALLASADGDQEIRSGSIHLSGDVVLAQQFQKLLRYGKPDLEEELSGLFGDVVAHRLGEFTRGMARWGRDVRTTMSQNVGEYLQEESGAVPGRHEADSFQEQVNTLRDDVARFEARLQRLETGDEQKTA